MKINEKNFIPLPLLFFCVCIFVGGFSACTAEEEEDYKVYAIQEGRFDLNENEYVTMQIIPADNSSPDLLRIDNHTEGCLTGGMYFSLAYFNKNNWESISIDQPWESVLLILDVGNTHDIRVDSQKDILFFVKTYNKGKKGRYRLIKNFSLVVDDIGHEFIGDVNLSAEFEIK